MDIIEGNKLFAEFLGKEYKDNCIVLPYKHYCGMNPSGNVWEETKYHSDWNWLMEVVEKCFATENNYFYHKAIEDALIFKSATRMNDVYNACFQFVTNFNIK